MQLVPGSERGGDAEMQEGAEYSAVYTKPTLRAKASVRYYLPDRVKKQMGG